MDLDNELGIPREATLSLPVSIPHQIALSFNGNNSLDEFISTAAPGTHLSSIPIRIDSSMRNTGEQPPPRCLIVGRQASASDIRVDHKSVSRRHTAFYFMTTSNELTLVVQDLGGKHGTILDDVRMEKYGTAKIALGQKKDYVIQFGNAPAKCRLVLSEIEEVSEPTDPAIAEQTLDETPKSKEESVAIGVNAIALDPATIDKQEQDTTSNIEPDTRESREAQIAAMIASFDSAPVYKKYVPTDEETNIGFHSAAMSKTNSIQTTNTQINTSNKYNLPITSSISLSPGSNSFSSSDGTNTSLQVNSSVSALCFEPSGARLVAGHRDGTLRFYDFHGMKPSTSSSGTYYTPFRIVDSDNDPLDSTGRHVLTCLGPSPSGAQWIVGTTSSQPKVIDREGSVTLFNFVKGDSYVTDSSNTKGHTAPVLGVGFNPLMRDICYSCSRDGSIRQWDVSGRGKMVFQKWLVCQKVIGKAKNQRGQRTQITSNIGIHPSGRKLVIGTSDGSIQVWNCFGSGLNTRPLGAAYSAHGNMKPVTYVTFSNDGTLLASRSDQDSTVRIWDANVIEKDSASKNRKLANRDENDCHSPSLLIAICKGLDALNEIPNCAFSPCGKFICAGSSINPRDTSANACGKIKFYQLPESEKSTKGKETSSSKSSNRKDTRILDPIVELDVAPKASVLGVAWHPKLNQIAFGTSNGM